jgi:uncharacterized protein YjbI with pentapeptide repeats
MKILNRWTNACLWEGEATSTREAVEKALAWGANLRGADLTYADLTYADLRGANLTGANLTGANLRGADLTYADLRGANLTGADLTGANLTGANLTHANLTGANLTGAILTGANLRDADLTHANLTGANLTGDKLKSAGQTASRSDGYEFRLFVLADGTLKIKAGCRWFTLTEAREHWTTTRGGTQLGEESLALIDHLARMQAIADRYISVSA